MLQTVHDTYDMNKYSQVGGEQTKTLTDEFINCYAFAGCVSSESKRRGALSQLGIGKFVLFGPNLAAHGPGEDAKARFIEEVAPALRARTP